VRAHRRPLHPPAARRLRARLRRARGAARHRQLLPPGQQLRRGRGLRVRQADRRRGAHPGRQLVVLPAAQARRAPARRGVRAGGDLVLRVRRPRRHPGPRLPAGLAVRAGPGHGRAGRGARRRRRAHPGRLARAVHGGARPPHVLPQRDGRARGRARLADLRPPRPRLDPRHLAGPARRPPSAPLHRPGEVRMSAATRRLTTAQALVRFLSAQYTERDGVRRRLVAGTWGIFGHGNVAGIGQALVEYADVMPYHQGRNEQSMVHAAVGHARQLNRLSAQAVTTSIGPGATNLVTGAALATINRLPVLLLPGDYVAGRAADPLLQQLEPPAGPDVSVNDTLRPVSRFFDRITRPEALIPSALQAMRVLADPAETGAVTL